MCKIKTKIKKDNIYQTFITEIGIFRATIFIYSIDNFQKTILLLRQIPVADLRELAHLSGREVKTLFS